MKYIKLLLVSVFFLASMLVGFWLVSENEAAVSLMLFGLALPELSLGLIVVMTFACGIFIGLLANMLVNSMLLLKIRSLNKKLNKSAGEAIGNG